ncbi:MAG: hypothetical protein A2Y33_12095 [Spirochaetes bacterium GWF1_51_8]|nr:MAG: hypothetical protein A2Y33_12095 [Spirochaetes bacterium GWF1_51_8]
MKISTRSRYGLRLMFELGLRYHEPLVQLKVIADTQQISEKYLSQIIIPLRAAGLVESVRGSQGGYRLAKTPQSITVREVIETLEGSLYPVDCSDGKECPRQKICPSTSVWTRLGDKIIETLDAITLENMIEDYRNRISADLAFDI